MTEQRLSLSLEFPREGSEHPSLVVCMIVGWHQSRSRVEVKLSREEAERLLRYLSFALRGTA